MFWERYRPRDVFINAAVIPAAGMSGNKAILNMIDDLSQLNFIGERSSKADYFGQKSKESIKVQAFSLNEIISKFCD